MKPKRKLRVRLPLPKKKGGAMRPKKGKGAKPPRRPLEIELLRGDGPEMQAVFSQATHIGIL